MHFADGWIEWPRSGAKKANAIVVTDESRRWLVPSAVYVLVKRFSAKEEARRVVAAVLDPERVPCDAVGIENHVNYVHAASGELSMPLAKGLALFLNSTVLDVFFRQFNGHTQVNATDLRNLKYPSRAALEELGSRVGEVFPEQDGLDRLVEQELMSMAKDSAAARAIRGKRKIKEAVALWELGFPREQLNERSALTLLAMLDLKPTSPWSAAVAPLRGVTPIMDYIAEHFGRNDAEQPRNGSPVHDPSVRASGTCGEESRPSAGYQ